MDTKSDEALQRDVLAELKWEPRVQPATEIGVAVKNGVVTLTGVVDSYTKRWAAEEAAHRVRGVRAVANDIEVRLPDSSERTDADVAAAALRAIEANSWLKAGDVHVTVSDGWVTLKGQVDWNFQREEAERSVRNLWGVKGISNLVTVRARPTPAQLKQEIEKALVRSAEADAKNIQVDVQGSKVILRGKVRAWAEREEAERVAWMAPGVTQIEDQIVVAS
jgi:osmotically-inducible protein OsmY